MKNYKTLFILLSTIVIFIYIGFEYIDMLKSNRDKIQNDHYATQAKNLQKQVNAMILSKQKSTVAMALSIAEDQHLGHNIKNNKIHKDYFKPLIKKFRDYTLYKNIWIQVLDKDLNSLYRSWSNKKGDNLASVRGDLRNMCKDQKPAYSISIGRFDLSLKAMVPIFLKGEFVGIIEIISHLNSIDRQLQKANITSLVVADKRFKRQLYYPFTKIFMDDYYIANFDAKTEHMDYLKSHGIEKYLNDEYKIENNFLIVSHSLKDQQDNPIGYFVMFKDLKKFKNMDADFFMFKWMAFSTIFLMIILLIVSFTFFSRNRTQKYYYKNILNSSTNIVVINDKQNIISVNNTFFKYFYGFKDLNDFKKSHYCICDLFENVDGYLYKEMDGVNWVEYLVEHTDIVNKVKIIYKNREYYFSVGASLIDEEKNHYSIVFTDITKEELYQIELHHISITDALTNIKNRRYFQEKIEDEITSCIRYEHPLSLIMFDIDHFKKINDKYGHDVGDDVLMDYSKFISSELRAGDTFCRVGGEEFIIILPYATKDNAYKIAEKIRSDVENSKMILPITMSFGVVEFDKKEDSKNLLKRLDTTLYKAKHSGRNKVVLG